MVKSFFLSQKKKAQGWWIKAQAQAQIKVVC